MVRHDFAELLARVGDAIEQMEEVFTTHELILKLAQANQRLYVEALYAYRDSERSPFATVHGRIGSHLLTREELELLERNAPSRDIFGNPGECGRWRRLQ